MIPSHLRPNGGRSKARPVPKKADYGRAWAASVPAEEAPPGLAPSAAFLRLLKDRYPTVMLRYDLRPFRKTFVLWERTINGHWVVIQDVPNSHPIDTRLLDYLAMCDLAKQPGVQSILDEVDAREEKRKADELAAARTRGHEPDPDRVLWAGLKDLRDTESYPMGVFVQVPGGKPRTAPRRSAPAGHGARVVLASA